MVRQRKNHFTCQSCGFQTPGWLGRCPDCGQWNSFIEEAPAHIIKNSVTGITNQAQTLEGISLESEVRLKTSINEFDRTLGGGIVPGSLVLIGGDPGIGKSTLILQMVGHLCNEGIKALYVSGEESLKQIKLRANRLTVQSSILHILTETCLENIFEQTRAIQPRLLIIDSIQTMYTDELASAPGSVGQVREVSARLLRWAKEYNIPVFLIGHVTKEGSIAGPKVLEHLVDAVLYLEGDQSHSFRILRAVKNRYGATNEIGVLEMKDNGLAEVRNPSRIFIEERPKETSGSTVFPCLEGSRPVLVEIQALVGQSVLGMPRRTAVGVDHNRISLLVAVLSKRLGLHLGDQDIFINVAGGLKVDEPAADLGIVSAMISSFLEKPIEMDIITFGEIGLSGEVRGVNQPELRIKEAKKLGFTKCLLSRSNLESCRHINDINLIGLETIQELSDHLF